MQVKQHIGNTVYVYHDYFPDGVCGSLQQIHSRSGEFYKFRVNNIQFYTSEIKEIDDKNDGYVIIFLK